VDVGAQDTSARQRADRSGGTKSDMLIGAVWPGLPYPRGATWDGEGVNFSLFSAHAEKVELCLFDQPDGPETTRIRSSRR